MLLRRPGTLTVSRLPFHENAVLYLSRPLYYHNFQRFPHHCEYQTKLYVTTLTWYTYSLGFHKAQYWVLAASCGTTVNDLAERLSPTVRIFADDTILHLAIQSMNDSATLQEVIWKLEKMVRQLADGADYCKVLRVTRKRTPLIFDY